MNPSPSRPRQARPEDWKRIRELCCLTGNSGDPIEKARWPFFAEHWVGPYQNLLPQWTLVSEREGSVQGYLTACPDTARFDRSKLLRFTLPLLARVALWRFQPSNDTRRFVRRALGLDQGPEESFPAEIRTKLLKDYPAHLHMNVDARFRSAGLGHELVAECFSRLRANGIPGIHLYCGPKPLAFYQRNGFAEIARLEFRPGVWVYALGARL